MPFGNFNKQQAMLTDDGERLLIGGPIDGDVAKVIEVCAWIVQGQEEGDAAATEMADVGGDSEDSLLLFTDVTDPKKTEADPKKKVTDGTEPGARWHLDDDGGKLRLTKKADGALDRVLEQVEPNADDPNEWLLLVHRKGDLPFKKGQPAIALAIAKATTKGGQERVESWAQTVMVVPVADDQNDLVERFKGGPAKAKKALAMSR